MIYLYSKGKIYTKLESNSIIPFIYSIYSIYIFYIYTFNINIINIKIDNIKIRKEERIIY